MESFFSRFKNVLFLIAVLLAQTVALATQVHRLADPERPDGQHVRLVRLWGLALISPFERLFSATGHGVRGVWSNYVELRSVRAQNKQLQSEMDRLRIEHAALSEDALEGQRLHALLGFRERFVGRTIAAQVIGTSGSEQSRLVTLDKGTRDGLRPGMAVITPDGIVGKLRDVFARTAQLLLINDPTSGAGVILQSTRVRAVLRGSPQGRAQILNLTPDARLKPGEVVLTSGGDQVFPRGLPVGTIESLAPDPDHQPFLAITLHTAANLNQLEEVLVITDNAAELDAKLHPQAEVTSSAANATGGGPGGGESRAADLSAERLPSVHDNGHVDAVQTSDGSTPQESAPPPPDNAPGLVPKPKPVLHPDRYSQGAAAPAAELKPGAPQGKQP